MKLMHLGDIHLGKKLREFPLIDDQKYMLDKLIDIMIAGKVAGVMVAGDIYDRSMPNESAVDLFDYFLRQLAKHHIKAYIISGNHDSEDRLNFGSRLFESNNLFICARYDGSLRKYVCEEDGEKVNIYLLPFIKASNVRYYFPDEKIDTYEDAVRTIIKHAEINPEETNILVAHQFVTCDEKDPETAGSESPIVASVGAVEKINYTCFDAFDYVALGHIHSYQTIGRNTVAYAGSMLKYSLSEIDHVKYAPIISIENGKITDIEKVRLIPKREIRRLKGRIDDLVNPENIEHPDDFILAVLEDEDMIDNAMGRMQMKYPNTLKIEYRDSEGNVEYVEADGPYDSNRPFLEIFNDFYREIMSEDINEEELEIIKEVAREAGVLNETD